MNNRPIKPSVVNTFDNPVVQIRCEPDKDEINVDEILHIVLARFQFVLGTSFDLQFLTMDGGRILALRRYIVTQVTEDIVTSEVNNYQTMTRTVYNRTCEPLGDFLIFDAVAEILLDGSPQHSVNKDIKDVDIDKMSSSELQSVMKSITGKGFPIGTSHKAMVKEIRDHM